MEKKTYFHAQYSAICNSASLPKNDALSFGFCVEKRGEDAGSLKRKATCPLRTFLLLFQAARDLMTYNEHSVRISLNFLIAHGTTVNKKGCEGQNHSAQTIENIVGLLLYISISVYVCVPPLRHQPTLFRYFLSYSLHVLILLSNRQ